MEDMIQDNFSAPITSSPKREREEAEPNEGKIQSKRVRKLKAPLTALVEKERTRGRYACLGHRMKHKRCPLDCPERRPRPEMDSPAATIKKENSPPVKTRTQRTIVSSKKKTEECTIVDKKETQTSEPVHPKSDNPHWDSTAWEGLAWDSEPYLHNEPVNWADLKSSSHWEEAKQEEQVEEKLMDHEIKVEHEIIDSWLNDDGFTSSMAEFDVGERNESDLERRSSPMMTQQSEELMGLLPKILLTRDILERWLEEPYFNRLVQGCFVRVKIGEYMGSAIHRIAHIDEVFDGSYVLYNLRRGQTTKGLSLQVGGSSKKTFPLIAISNTPPTEADLRNWQEEMDKNNIFLDPLEVKQKEEIVRVLHIKYPCNSVQHSFEPLVNEPTAWPSC